MITYSVVICVTEEVNGLQEVPGETVGCRITIPKEVMETERGEVLLRLLESELHALTPEMAILLMRVYKKRRAST